ncbi:MAG: hypothetical protein H6642_12940 [Caldilineaceae bacterium]|nr:hypothetical protein [Caldilineaceae bacterium]
MQARRMTLPRVLVVLFAGLLLSACGGGNTGSTWFNLPSAPVEVQENGTASVYGFNLGQILDPAMVSQLQGAGAEKLDVRIGYEGVMPLLNGESLPYVNWDQGSVAEVQSIVQSMPNLPNAGLISRALPMLRTFGVGVSLNLPGDSVPNWNGSTPSMTATGEDQAAVGPVNLGGLAVDDQGAVSLDGISLGDLGAAVNLPPQVMSMVQQLGVNELSVDTSPNGIQLSMDGRSLPGLTFDPASLNRALGVAGAFVDAPTQAMLDQAAPLLESSDINVALSFTGEPTGETDLGNVPVTINEDGTLSAFGLSMGDQPVLDAATLGMLQDANIQQLSLDVQENGLNLAANGKKLPSVSWNEDSLPVLAGVVGGVAGIPPATLESGLDVLRNSGLSTSVNLPPKAGEAAMEMPESVDFTYAPPELGDLSAPVVKLDATLNQDGSLAEAAGLDQNALAGLGLGGPLVPANVMAILDSLGASEVNLTSDPDMLHLFLDGSEALTVQYDQVSLENALDLAVPLLGDASPLANPDLQELIRTVFLPLLPGSDLDVTVHLN